jgi:hypothetical protein
MRTGLCNYGNGFGQGETPLPSSSRFARQIGAIEARGPRVTPLTTATSTNWRKAQTAHAVMPGGEMRREGSRVKRGRAFDDGCPPAGADQRQRQRRLQPAHGTCDGDALIPKGA